MAPSVLAWSVCTAEYANISISTCICNCHLDKNVNVILNLATLFDTVLIPE